MSYMQGLRDAVKTLKSLLQHNDIMLKRREFYKEYLNLIDEGKINSPLSHEEIINLMKGKSDDNNKSSFKN